MARLVAFVLLLALLPSAARAQVNAEAIRSQLSKDSRILNLDASLTTRAGNTVGSTLSAGVLGAIIKYRHLAFLRGQVDYGNAQSVTTVAKAFAHARYNYTVTHEVTGEVYGQLQSDRFIRMAFRKVAGIGPRFEIVHRNNLEIFAATSFMFENEILLASATDTSHNDTNYRTSTYAGINYVIDEKSQITAVTYLQPKIDKPKDFRVLHESAVILGITKLLAVKLGITFRYDSEPPIGVRPADIEVKNSLQLRF